MKARIVTFAAALVIAAGLVWWFTRPTSPSLGKAPAPTATPHPRQDASRAILVKTETTGLIEWPAAESRTKQLNNPDNTATDDLEVVDALFADFRGVFGEVPEGGLNEEITSGLLGKNPGNILFLKTDPKWIGPRGEMLDRWGHPLFFHKISGTQIDLRSAGPDGKLWTPDDVEISGPEHTRL